MKEVLQHPEVGCFVRDSPGVTVRDCPLSLVWQSPSCAHVGVRRVLASVWLWLSALSAHRWVCVQLSWEGPSHPLCHGDSAALSPLPSPHSGQYLTLACAWSTSLCLYSILFPPTTVLK